MKSARELPEAIQWHEGMLLAPQHFQQANLRQEALLHYHAAMMAPFHWGVRHLEIDQVLLISGTLRVLELEAILPDGTVVYLQSTPGEALEIDLKQYAEELKQGEVTVHLALPEQGGSGGATRGKLSRYQSIEGQTVVDLNTGEGEMRIPRLRPRLSLLVTDSPPKKYTSFPLLKLTYRNETFGLSDYIPPILQVSVKSPLGELCTTLAQRLREKALFLAKKVRGSTVTVKAPMILETKQMIQSIVSALPPFEAALYTGVTHPMTLYLALCSLVGHLAAVGTSLVPPVLPVYQHHDLRNVFLQAQDFIFRMLDEGVLESHLVIPFTLEKEVFSLLLQEAWMKEGLVLGVIRQANVSEEQTLHWIKGAVIGSQTKIESMRERRVLGPDRQRIDKVGDFVPSSGVLLFSIKENPQFIEPQRLLCLFNTSDRGGATRPSEIVLYVKNPAAGTGAKS